MNSDPIELIREGLDDGFAEQLPALEQMFATGSLRDQHFACAVLAAWNQPQAIARIAEWARAPERTPWADAPFTFDRFTGADDAFELLAESLQYAPPSPQRTDAVRALLSSFERTCTGRKLYELLDLDDALAEEVRTDVAAAIERALVTDAKFDLQTQTASLLAFVDDELAARAARSLVANHRGLLRTLNEIAVILGFCTGPATYDVLEELALSAPASVREFAQESLQRRSAS